MTSNRRTTLGLALAFLGLSVLVAGGATRGLDRWVLEAAQFFAAPTLDLLASLVTILGQAEITAVVAVALAIRGWRRDGLGGLGPLLLFGGVAIEVVMKHVVPHPGPPEAFHRTLPLLPFLHGRTPYAFPSGHVLRTTFLAGLIGARAPRWAGRALAAVVVAMALTRVYLAEHWLSDVLGGAVLGLFLAGIALDLRGRLVARQPGGRPLMSDS